VVVVGDSGGELPDSAGLVVGDSDVLGLLGDADGVPLGPLVVAVPDGSPAPGDEAVPDADGVGTGRPGTSVGEAEGIRGDVGVPGRSGRVVSPTVPGSPDGTPGTGSIVFGANGVAPMKLRTSTTVYAAHSAPSP
jgi:hypothetical protein